MYCIKIRGVIELSHKIGFHVLILLNISKTFCGVFMDYQNVALLPVLANYLDTRVVYIKQVIKKLPAHYRLDMDGSAEIACRDKGRVLRPRSLKPSSIIYYTLYLHISSLHESKQL
jgi:hypothetical protein